MHLLSHAARGPSFLRLEAEVTPQRLSNALLPLRHNLKLAFSLELRGLKFSTQNSLEDRITDLLLDFGSITGLLARIFLAVPKIKMSFNHTVIVL